MENYTYVIKAFDVVTGNMSVQYTPANNALTEYTFNIPAPKEGVDVDEYVNNYAPQEQWEVQKNPNYSIIGLVGASKTIDASKYDNVLPPPPTKQLYDDIKRLEAEFFAEMQK